MNARTARMWAVCAMLGGALVSLASSPPAAAQVDPATGLVGAASRSQSSQEEEPPGVAATGVGPNDTTFGERSRQAETAPPTEGDQANVDRSGVLVGQPVAGDRPAAATPAATGLGR